MRHTVVLTESFDSPFEWRWLTRAAEEWKAVFTTPAGIYDVRIGVSELGNTTWSIEFGPANRDAEDGNEKFGIHNLGNQTVASRILATVIAAIKDFVKLHSSVQQFFFQSVEPSRTKLYIRMVQRLLGPMSGWKTEVTPGQFAASFVLKRDDATVDSTTSTTTGMGSGTGPTQ